MVMSQYLQFGYCAGRDGVDWLACLSLLGGGEAICVVSAWIAGIFSC